MAIEMNKDIDVTKLYDLVNKLANLYRNELININAVASGKLVNFTREIDWDGTKFTVQFLLPEHYGAIEFGRKPTEKASNKHLIDAIKDWIKIKGIQSRDGIDEKSLAFLITRKIHKQGFFGVYTDPEVSGKHPLRKALDRARADGTIDAIADCVADGLGNQIKVSLAELENMTTKK